MQKIIHFLVGVVNAQAETDAAAGAGGLDAHRGQDMGRIRASRWCRPNRWRRKSPVWSSMSKMPSASTKSKAMLLVLGRRGSLAPLRMVLGMVVQNGVLQPVAQGADAGVFVVEMGQGQFRRAAKGDDAGDVFRAGARLPRSWWPPMQIRLEFGPALDVEQADALGRMKFVGGKGQQIRRPAP